MIVKLQSSWFCRNRRRRFSRATRSRSRRSCISLKRASAYCANMYSPPINPVVMATTRSERFAHVRARDDMLAAEQGFGGQSLSKRGWEDVVVSRHVT